jgi:cell pole-organizing protein PopZ
MSGDVTLHTMVESALRPMLKQWLDANLPAMVERIVATEIARITGRR